MSTEKPPDIPRLAHAYRRLVLWFGAQLFLTLASVWLQFGVPGGTVGSPTRPLVVPLTLATISFSSLLPVTPAAIALVIGNLVIVIALAYYAYRTAEALGLAAPILFVVAMVMPCVSILALVFLSSRATAVCRDRGIPVGLFGPKLSS